MMIHRAWNVAMSSDVVQESFAKRIVGIDWDNESYME